MASLIAVVAHDCRTLSLTHVLLGAKLLRMPQGGTLQTVGYMVLNNNSGVIQARHDLVASLGPSLGLLGALRLVAKPIRNRVLLVQVALKVHVRVRREQRALHGNEVQREATVENPLLELKVGHLRTGLGILLDGVLDIVDVTIVDGFHELIPGVVGGCIRDLAAIDDPGVLTLCTGVSFW